MAGADAVSGGVERASVGPEEWGQLDGVWDSSVRSFDVDDVHSGAELHHRRRVCAAAVSGKCDSGQPDLTGWEGDAERLSAGKFCGAEPAGAEFSASGLGGSVSV